MGTETASFETAKLVGCKIMLLFGVEVDKVDMLYD